METNRPSDFDQSKTKNEKEKGTTVQMTRVELTMGLPSSESCCCALVYCFQPPSFPCVSRLSFCSVNILLHEGNKSDNRLSQMSRVDLKFVSVFHRPMCSLVRTYRSWTFLGKRLETIACVLLAVSNSFRCRRATSPS